MFTRERCAVKTRQLSSTLLLLAASNAAFAGFAPIPEPVGAARHRRSSHRNRPLAESDIAPEKVVRGRRLWQKPVARSLA